eukprot:scaffold344_cov130-Cylindrotheca_fusiformis.AAC.17
MASDAVAPKRKTRKVSSWCKICKTKRPLDSFPDLPCCCTIEINEEVCCTCLVAALTKPTDNKCPRCREFVTLASCHVNDKPPWDVQYAKITMGVVDQCVSCGEKKRLKPPNNICADCQREKETYPKGLNYECQVCHEYQNIPYPLYKTQPNPRKFGNSRWWACKSKCCAGSARRWRIVESDIDKLNPGDAPHSWAQYYIRRKLNKLPPNPALHTAEANLSPDSRFQIESIDRNAKTFLVASSKFPIDIGPEDDNADWAALKTTLRVRNERTNTIETILAHRLSNDVVLAKNIGSNEGDLEAGDWLEAIDYVALTASFLSRQEFSIEKASTLVPNKNKPDLYQETPELGWQLHPYNIRIGKIGIVGHEFHSILLKISVENPVSILWTDAVKARIEFSTDGDHFAEVKGNKDIPSIRQLPNGSVVGSLYFRFHSINLDSLSGLVSNELGGGMHIAVLASRDDAIETVETDRVEELAEADSLGPESPTILELQEKIWEMPSSEKRNRFLAMIENESQRDMFEKNVDGDDLDLVLEEMVTNEDFIRRFLGQSSSTDEFGWVAGDSDEDVDGDSPKKSISSRSGHDSSRWTVVYSPDDNRVIVDAGEQSQVFSHRPSSKSDIVRPTVTEDLEAPTGSIRIEVGPKFEKQRSPHGSIVQMDGLHSPSNSERLALSKKPK